MAVLSVSTLPSLSKYGPVPAKMFTSLAPTRIVSIDATAVPSESFTGSGAPFSKANSPKTCTKPSISSFSRPATRINSLSKSRKALLDGPVGTVSPPPGRAVKSRTFCSVPIADPAGGEDELICSVSMPSITSASTPISAALPVADMAK